MTPRQRQQRIDADAWRLVCVLTVGSWLAVDPAPMAWPAGFWLLALFGAWCVHEVLAGRDKPY